MSSKEDPDVMSSFSHGAQECNETVCEPCSEGGSLLKAEGYCIRCKEFLCQTCIQHHKRLKITRNHQIQGPDEMPKTKSACEAEQDHLPSQDVPTAECKVHNKEIIEFYCKDHRAVGCAVCVTLSHASCANILRVVDVSIDETVTNELERFDQRLNDVSAGFRTLLQTAEKNHLEVKNRNEKLLLDISIYKESAIETINKLANSLEMEVQKMTQENQIQIDQRMKHCNTLQKHTELLSNELKGFQTNNQKTEEFILMTQSEHQLEVLETDIRNMNANTQFKNYVFCPDLQLRSTHTKTKIMGQIVEDIETVTCACCKEIDMKSFCHHFACKHNICRVCANGSINGKQTCAACGKVTVQCQRCHTAVFQSSVTFLACRHDVCLSCRKQQTEKEDPCKYCDVITGNQPDGSFSDEIDKYGMKRSLIKVEFNFPGGKQKCYHPRPGEAYKGGTLTCYLRNDKEGKELYEMLKTAFNRKLVCKIEDDAVTTNIELWKTEDGLHGLMYGPHSYDSYSHRLTKRLRDLGITA